MRVSPLSATKPRPIHYVILLAIGCAGPRSAALESAAAVSADSCTLHRSRDSTVFDTTQVSRKPIVLSGPRLEYPDGLRRRRISGRVIYAVTINADGSLDPGTVDVIRSDHPDFEWNARQYIQEARFAPGCRAGQAVRVRMALPIDFRIVR